MEHAVAELNFQGLVCAQRHAVAARVHDLVPIVCRQVSHAPVRRTRRRKQHERARAAIGARRTIVADFLTSTAVSSSAMAAVPCGT